MVMFSTFTDLGSSGPDKLNSPGVNSNFTTLITKYELSYAMCSRSLVETRK